MSLPRVESQLAIPNNMYFMQTSKNMPATAAPAEKKTSCLNKTTLITGSLACLAAAGVVWCIGRKPTQFNPFAEPSKLTSATITKFLSTLRNDQKAVYDASIKALESCNSPVLSHLKNSENSMQLLRSSFAASKLEPKLSETIPSIISHSGVNSAKEDAIVEGIAKSLDCEFHTLNYNGQTKVEDFYQQIANTVSQQNNAGAESKPMLILIKNLKEFLGDLKTNAESTLEASFNLLINDSHKSKKIFAMDESVAANFYARRFALNFENSVNI